MTEPDDDLQFTPAERARLWQVISEETSDPGEAMEASLRVALLGGVNQPEPEPEPPAPRLPAFNPAQGSSAAYGSPPPSPGDVFADFMLDALSARPNIAH